MAHKHQGKPAVPQTNQSPFQAISAVDYTIIFARDMAAMRQFYEDVLQFTFNRALSENWIKYTVGPNTFVLSKPGYTATDDPTPKDAAALQLAFKVTAAQVDACAVELEQRGVTILSPPTDRDFGHRALFFRDPDGNLLEIYAEI